MDSQGGKLLIAVPDLSDSNFFRTVVLVIEHSADGAIGVVLNRPSEVKLACLWEGLDSDTHVERDGIVYIGGPVTGPLLALHDHYGFSDTRVIDGVYMTMASDQLNRLVGQKVGNLKVFSGYSGWAANQLDREIESGGGLLVDAKPSHVFDPRDQLWKSVCDHLGHEIMLPRFLRQKNLGDPDLN